MEKRSRPILILVADDDADDRVLLEEAFEENRLANERRFVAGVDENDFVVLGLQHAVEKRREFLDVRASVHELVRALDALTDFRIDEGLSP